MVRRPQDTKMGMCFLLNDQYDCYAIDWKTFEKILISNNISVTELRSFSNWYRNSPIFNSLFQEYKYAFLKDIDGSTIVIFLCAHLIGRQTLMDTFSFLFMKLFHKHLIV